MRRQAEMKNNELQMSIEDIRKDRDRLGDNIQELKVLAQQSQARITRYDLAIRKVLTYIEEARPELDG